MNTLLAIAAFLESSKYVLLWLGCYFEGTVAMMTGGLLVRLNDANMWLVYPILISADFIADVTWYVLGYFGGRHFIVRWGYLVGFTETVIAKLEDRFHEYHTSILLISKLTMGFGLATGVLFTAGMMRLSFMRFAIINLVGGLVWVGCMMAIGYYFGDVISLVPVKYQAIGAITVLVLAFFFVRRLTARLAASEW